MLTRVSPLSIRSLTLIAALAGAAGLAAAQGDEPAQFNLRCTFENEALVHGTQDEAAIYLWGHSDQPKDYRIDTAAKRLCSGECGYVEAMDVTPDGMLVLDVNRSMSLLTGQPEFVRTEMLLPGRQTMQVAQMAKTAAGTPVGTLQTYRCTTTPFSGFPG